MRIKIINDPVYGFLQLPAALMHIVDHPILQRLRRIQQMGMAHLVYPGAVHTRFAHSLGACHLMGKALSHLSAKGTAIPHHTIIAAQQAILLHDAGHGPCSHALEHSIIRDISHEQISLALMQQMNKEMDGALSEAISIFENKHELSFLHQLVSGQLDMDRMDYLNRDSFYSGVSEGVIGYDRILNMIAVEDGKLLVEEKGIHSIEKFLIARRIMYQQVYLHKAVVAAEYLIMNIMRRAKELAMQGIELRATPALHYFLYHDVVGNQLLENDEILERYKQLDDSDIAAAVKVWVSHQDPILAKLCSMLLNRKLYKVRYVSSDDNSQILSGLNKAATKHGYSESDLQYIIITGIASTETYEQHDPIHIRLKSGAIKDVTEVEHALLSREATKTIHKPFIGVIPELAAILNQHL